MNIADFKRWHWIVVGLLVGLALAYVNVEGDPPTVRTLGQDEFERELVAKDVKGERPNLANLRIHPPMMGAYGKEVQLVTFDRAVYDQKRQGWEYQAFGIVADIPYKPRRNVDAAAGVSTVQDYIAKVAEQHDHVAARYAWWKEPKWGYTMWPLGAVLVLGGIWPTIVNLLVGAGLGPQKSPEPEYDLDRFSKHEEPARAPTPARREVSQEEQERLHALTAGLEKSLGRRAVGMADHADTPLPLQTQAHEPVRKLDAKPLEAVAVQATEEEKDYKGEFYPVARQMKK